VRLDQALVERGLAPSRSAAARLIASGAVQLEGQLVVRAALKVAPHASIGLAESLENRFVSRAGAKLEGLLAARSDIRITGYWVDLGQGTGGFTHCLLERGARRVLGIDVGHGQLHAQLRSDPRICAVEGLNLRDLPHRTSPSALDPAWPQQGASGVVVDASFISLEHALKPAADLLSAQSWLIALIKPQFELGAHPGDRRRLLRRGVVSDASLYPRVFARIVQCLGHLGMRVNAPEDLRESCLRGQEGNREFFVVARKFYPQGGSGGLSARRTEL
jgi:23S rRNA (cytidine1920-2'-O)/16S rRNA (cytidine1409-2'-O)-methyltransferase